MTGKQSFKIESAIALTPTQIDQLLKLVPKSKLGSLEVINEVNPSLLGGLRISYAGRMLDMTVKNQLAELQTHLTNHV